MDRFQEFTENSELNRDRLLSEMTQEQTEALESRLLQELQNPAEGEPIKELPKLVPYESRLVYNDHGVRITEHTKPLRGEEEGLGEGGEELEPYLTEGYFEELEDGRRLRHPPRLDPEKLAEQGDDRFIGEPLRDLEHWHQQETPTSCAVACQDYIIDVLTDASPTEQELRELAQEEGWYREGDGTPDFAIGKIAEHFGLHTDVEPELTLEQVKSALEQGDKLIASVDSRLLYYPDSAEYTFAEFLKQGCHAVQITGLDMSDPDDVKVILNDPLLEDGGGNVYSWEEFSKCSEDILFRIHA